MYILNYIMYYFTIFFVYVAIISLIYIYSSGKRTPTRIPSFIISLYNILNSLINLYVACGLSKYVYKNLCIYIVIYELEKP